MGVTTDKVSDFNRLAALQGQALVAGNFALSAGFGTTASIAVAANSTITRGEATVTSAGTGQGASPTVTLTIPDGAYTSAPFVVAIRCAGDQLTVAIAPTTRNAGSIVFTFQGTPIAAETYKFAWVVIQ